MKIVTFGTKYAQEKYPSQTVKGFKRENIKELNAWYGGNVRYMLTNGIVRIFVGEKGTIDAGVYFDDIPKVDDVDDLRQLYRQFKHEESKKTWTKPLIVERLTGVSQ